MNTPICDYLKKYSDKKYLRLHMPGHKGSGFLGIEQFDITEVDGADVLYNGNGIIFESEKNASKIFNTKKTLYSTEGSSLSIRAMVYLSMLYAKNNNKKPKILAFRNAHKSFMNAIAMLDIDVEWVYPSENDNLISCIVSPSDLEKKIKRCKKPPTALYITSPDYLGNIADISSFSEICKKNGMLLLVDNAHGAYLAFNNTSNHPIHLGADITCDSAHKTLPVITGGGYLHISKTAPDFLAENAEIAMQFFASTSPSYLIMASIDHFNSYADNFKIQLNNFKNDIFALKEEISNHGYKLVGDEILKLTIMPKSYGYTGIMIGNYLLKNNINYEFADKDFIVMMFSPFMEKSQLDKLKNLLLSLPAQKEITEKPPKVIIAQKATTIRNALISNSALISTQNASGKILASANISCPPAIPIIVAGELIDEKAIESFNYYGIKEIRVIK